MCRLGAAPHLVDLSSSTPACDCPDRHFRGRECKHIAAAKHYRCLIIPELRAISDELEALMAERAGAIEDRARLRPASQMVVGTSGSSSLRHSATLVCVGAGGSTLSGGAHDRP